MPPIVLDHIAIGARQLADAPDFLVGELGGVPSYGGPTGDYVFWTWEYPGGARLEVLEPEGPPGGFLHRFLERNGPGIHHITFYVRDLDAMCDRARAAGHSIVEGREGSEGYREAFLHPKTAMGIVVQLTVAHDLDDDGEHRGPPGGQAPPSPAAASPPAQVIGLRMRSADRERALRQWGELLEGEVETDDGNELTFRWPESAMRVRVMIDAGSADRSEAIEIAAPPAPISEEPHPLLGVRFDVLEGERASLSSTAR
jgi:methylmalonyl-CoA/ethylmalonyl-CoA epimerase